MRVSRSGYYKWVISSPSERAKKALLVKEAIKEVFAAHQKRFGSAKVHKELIAQGFDVGKNRVAQIMRHLGLRAKTCKRYRVVTTDSKHNLPVAENLLDRQFSVSKPNKVFVSDITYVKTSAGWAYLAVFIDLYSRMVVGWSVSNSLKTDLVLKAFDHAVKNRGLRRGDKVMIHSDRGSQYAGDDFRKALQTYEFVQSMSRKGNCWDNAVAESFFKIYKSEMAYHCKFKNADEVWRKTFEYIEGYYNRKRIHGTLGYLTPEQFEMYFHKQAA